MRCFLLLLAVVAGATALQPNEAIQQVGDKIGEGTSCPSSLVKRATKSGLNRGGMAQTHAGLLALARGNADEAAACFMAAVDGGDSAATAALADAAHRLGLSDTAASLFNKASEASAGAPVTNIRAYEILGPFSIGKLEFDGDPLSAPGLGGVESLPRGKGQYMSEYAEGGLIGWQIFPENPARVLFPRINWQKHVELSTSHPILEWQAWAVGDIIVSQPGNYAVSCKGVHTFSIGSEPGVPWLTGDIYNSGIPRAPVSLQAGVHSIWARVRAKVQGSLHCVASVAQDLDSRFAVHGQATVADVYDGRIVGGGYVSFPVSNMDAERWLTGLRASSDSGPISVGMVEAGDIAPGQTTSIILGLSSSTPLPFSTCPTPFKVDISGTLNGTELTKRVTVRVRCRKAGQSFMIPFIDFDGTASQAAVIAPLPAEGQQDGEGRQEGGYPVLLTMHGTGVSANDQADSYKRQPKIGGDFVFGVAGAWVLAPTRHGAHNWEGIGMRSGTSALEALGRWGGGDDVEGRGVDAGRVLFAGHSMGGHGAWVISTHFPDLALGVASAAGWIRKEYYGDSNVLFNHDLSNAHADAALKGLLESTVVDNYVDLMASNLGGIPVLARVGAEDRSVPPWQQRRMTRVLDEAGIDVRYDEVPQKEHWWWDTKSESDGGCVNDGTMRSFFADQIQKNSSRPEYVGEGKKLAGKKKAPVQRGGSKGLVPAPEEFEVVVPNPGSFGSKGGIRVLQQSLPHRISRVSVKTDAGSRVRHITTTNVRRLAFSAVSGANDPHPGASFGVVVDGVAFDQKTVRSLYEGYAESGSNICRAGRGGLGNWEVCGGEYAKTERSPSNYGPARQVFESPFIISPGSCGDSDANSCSSGARGLLQGAVYLANLHKAAADTKLLVVPDTHLDHQQALSHNLLLLGTPSQNKWAHNLRESIPVRFGPAPFNETSGLPAVPHGAFAIGNCVFSGPGIGLITTFPLPRTTLLNASKHHLVQAGGSIGLLVSGTDSEGLRDALSLAQPTIPPMVRSPYTNTIPDYIVTGPTLRWKGFGGILAAGYWSNHWSFSPETAYTAEDCSVENRHR